MTAATALGLLGAVLILFGRPVRYGAMTDETMGMILLALSVALDPSWTGKAVMVGLGAIRACAMLGRDS